MVPDLDLCSTAQKLEILHPITRVSVELLSLSLLWSLTTFSFHPVPSLFIVNCLEE